ncbi:MAG: NAD-binding protein, partial [Brevundimonas sp.]|nr:NAD-binding protein [Brevundimonas sp.]
LGLLVVLGRLVLRPLFRSVAKTQAEGRGQEMFVAACLLVVVGAGLGAQAAGLSMSLGALVAGLLLAETEFRRAVEVSIEPFKGLLLGVFFVGVGIGLDLDAVAADPVAVFGLALMLTLFKAGLIYGVARLWGVKNRTAIETALVLGPAGEFAFVILGAGLVEGIASPGFTGTVMLAATISIFTVPLMAMFADRLARRVEATQPDLPPEAMAIPSIDGQVLIVGFGRVGRLVGELLAEHGQKFVAVDANASTVSKGRAEGSNVFYGDAGNTEMLQRCGIGNARAMVVTMDSPAKVDDVVSAARSLRPDLILIARARDSKHAERLYRLGVTDAVPETTEASLQLAENTLVDLGVPMGRVLASIHERRDRFRKLFQEAMPDSKGERLPRALRSTNRRAGTTDQKS